MVLIMQHGNICLLLRRISLISEIRKSMKAFMDLPPRIQTFYQLHTQEKNTQSTELKTQSSNTCNKRKILQTIRMLDQMFGISSMRTSDQFHNTEEKLHQSTLSSQENPVKELRSSQQDQAVQLPKRQNHWLRSMNLKPELKGKLPHLLHNQRKL